MTPDASSASPSKAPRRRLPPEERTQSILEAGIQEFAEAGYAGASMASIARRASVTKGLIYHYFPGKADLFKAVIRSCIQPAFAEAERLIAGFGGSRTDLLRLLLDLAYARITNERRDQVLFKMILSESDRFPELAALYRAEVLEPALRLMGAAIRGGLPGKVHSSALEDEVLAAVAIAPVILAAIWRMVLGEAHAPPLEGLREAHLRMVLQGVLDD